MHLSRQLNLFSRFMTNLARSRSRSHSPVSGLADEPPSKRLKTVIENKSYDHIPEYNTGLHLAPMVRCGTLPTRLLSLHYGANLVWGPEIVDRALLGCERQVSQETGVVSFVKEGKPVWDTHPIEKKRLIFQIGSASPEQALEAAKLIQDDVSGVDLNCGCPKRA